MENATKALMIAAAVIVVLLIIGLGIGVFNMASEQVDNAGDLSEYQIEQFNAKFRKYEGTNVSGSDVLRPIIIGPIEYVSPVEIFWFGVVFISFSLFI